MLQGQGKLRLEDLLHCGGYDISHSVNDIFTQRLHAYESGRQRQLHRWRLCDLCIVYLGSPVDISKRPMNCGFRVLLVRVSSCLSDSISITVQ